MGATSAERACLTMDFVGKMTTYELRQEAEKRGLLEKMPVVNHAALLQRLVQASIATLPTKWREIVEILSAQDINGKILSPYYCYSLFCFIGNYHVVKTCVDIRKKG